MAILISGFHNDIRSQLKKYNSAFVSPGDIDIAINKSCIDVLQMVINEYESGGAKASVDQELLKLHSFTGDASERALPTDVFKLSTVFIGDYEGDVLNDKEFNERLNSVILPPSATRPIATVYNDGAKKIRILPTSSTHKIKYWKNPAIAIYNFTASDGIPVYNPTGSVDIDFPMSEYTRLINRTLVYLTPAAKDPESAQLESNINR
jgi:hypothetical protein